MLDMDEAKGNWLSKSETYPCMYYEEKIVYIIKNIGDYWNDFLTRNPIYI